MFEWDDFFTHGFSGACHECRAITVDGDDGRLHSEACRKRTEDIMVKSEMDTEDLVVESINQDIVKHCEEKNPVDIQKSDRQH